MSNPSFHQTKLFASNPNSASNNRESAKANDKNECMSKPVSRKRPAEEIEDVVEIIDLVSDSTCGVVPFDRFLDMWHDVEVDDGWDTEAFESTGSFRKANTSLSKDDTSTQSKAQYGRIMFKATAAIFERVMGLKWFHTFLDIGHGVGNTVLQAAYTVGCESLGIEVVSVRHDRAVVYQEKLAELDDLLNKKRDGKNYSVGPVRMRHGSLEAPEHFNFLTQNIDVAFCNNFGEVFGERCKKSRQMYSMDDYIAGLFTRYKRGAIMVTLHPLPLGSCREQVNAIRARHGLPTSNEASFYAVEDYEVSGKGLLSWTDKSFVVYKYTKLGNSFLCCNPNCEKAVQMTPIEASRKEGDCFVLNHCDCGVGRTTRRAADYECKRHELHVD